MSMIKLSCSLLLLLPFSSFPSFSELPCTGQSILGSKVSHYNYRAEYTSVVDSFSAV